MSKKREEKLELQLDDMVQSYNKLLEEYKILRDGAQRLYLRRAFLILAIIIETTVLAVIALLWATVR